MRVIVASGGKWSAFDQASELDKRGHLVKLITTYYSQKRGILPLFRQDSERISPLKVVTNILPEAIKHMGRHVPLLRRRDLPFYLAAEAFDTWAASHIEACDILLAWSSFALYTGRAAKANGAITIVYRASLHTLTEASLLEEEFEKIHGKSTLSSRVGTNVHVFRTILQQFPVALIV